jgi:hypothetical protein
MGHDSIASWKVGFTIEVDEDKVNDLSDCAPFSPRQTVLPVSCSFLLRTSIFRTSRHIHRHGRRLRKVAHRRSVR